MAMKKYKNVSKSILLIDGKTVKPQEVIDLDEKFYANCSIKKHLEVQKSEKRATS